MSACFVTVVSADEFQRYVPLWLYSWHRAYPEVALKVWVTGRPSGAMLQLCQSVGLSRYTIYPDAYTNIIDRCKGRPSVCNALRFLLPEDVLYKYDYTYVLDVDLLGFRLNPAHVAWFRGRMDSQGAIGAYRSPYRKPRRPSIYEAGGWRGKFARVAAGTVLLGRPWWKLTHEARNYYLHLARSGQHDDQDKHPFGSYREYDEVMLQRICTRSGITIPTKRYRFYDGTRWPTAYRGIHVGDFKFRKQGKLRRIHKKVGLAYRLLCQDEQWQRLCSWAREAEQPRVLLRRLNRRLGVE